MVCRGCKLFAFSTYPRLALPALTETLVVVTVQGAPSFTFVKLEASKARFAT